MYMTPFSIGNIKISHFPIILAPLEDVTDPPFRKLCKRFGADIVYTEFISSEGLIRDAEKSLHKLDISDEERPVGIQIFGHDEDSMRRAAETAAQANPDLIDINWGCPVKKVIRKGAGAGILQDIPKMIRITEAVVKATNLPVTVKTRLGWDESSKPIVEVAERLQDVGIKALSIHGRTRAQLYGGKADWSLIGEVKNNARMHIPIIGNGDITSPEIALEKKDRYGVDGIMIGRASLGNPWIFREIKYYLETGTPHEKPTISERVEICREHLRLEVDWKNERTAVFEMRKHYSKYFAGLYGIKSFRMQLVKATSFSEVETILDQILVDFL